MPSLNKSLSNTMEHELEVLGKPCFQLCNLTEMMYDEAIDILLWIPLCFKYREDVESLPLTWLEQ